MTGQIGFGHLSIFNLEEKWNADKSKGCCDKFSIVDELLQEYFKDLGIAIGIQSHNSFSLFDIPSMMTSSFNYKGDSTDINQQQIRDAFIYSQCKAGSLKSDFAIDSTPHICFEKGWNKFVKGEAGELIKKKQCKMAARYIKNFYSFITAMETRWQYAKKCRGIIEDIR